MSKSYHAKMNHVDSVTKLIARTTSGRKLLEQFLPLLKKGTFRIEPYPAGVLKKLREVIPADQPIGACLIREAQGGTIFIDTETPIGIIAPFLVHEIIHALAGKKEFALVEESAFQGQYLFTQELRERDPNYDIFLRTQFPKAKFLHKLLEFDVANEAEDLSDYLRKRA